MVEPLDVRCPTCFVDKGSPCNTVILGGGLDHSGRVVKARNWERSVEASRKKSKPGIPQGRKVQLVEPIGSDDLDGFILASKCQMRGCFAREGQPCVTKGNLKWHSGRRKRGAVLMERYREANS